MIEERSVLKPFSNFDVIMDLCTLEYLMKIIEINQIKINS